MEVIQNMYYKIVPVTVHSEHLCYNSSISSEAFINLQFQRHQQQKHPSCLREERILAE